MVVSIVAGKLHAARHGRLDVGRPHLLDIVLVVGVDNGRDVKVSEAHPAGKVYLSEHTGNIGATVLDGIEVANVTLGERDVLLLPSLDHDWVHRRGARAGSEVDGAVNSVERPEGNGTAGAGESSRGHQGSDSIEEAHDVYLLFLGENTCYGGYVSV